MQTSVPASALTALVFHGVDPRYRRDREGFATVYTRLQLLALRGSMRAVAVAASMVFTLH